MDRKEFLKTCGYACVGLVGLSAFLQSCTATQYVQGTVTNQVLQVSKNDFLKIKDDKTIVRKYILVKPQESSYPLVVYRNSDNSYTALLLRCTHQDNELSVNGDMLTCSAHGSEFDRNGLVLQGPAEDKLKSFPVTSDENNIYIRLA